MAIVAIAATSAVTAAPVAARPRASAIAGPATAPAVLAPSTAVRAVPKATPAAAVEAEAFASMPLTACSFNFFESCHSVSTTLKVSWSLCLVAS